MGENKERIITPIISEKPVVSVVEKEILVDVEPKAEVPKEVESWLEKIEQDPVAKTIKDDQGNAVMTPNTGIVKINLPVTKKTFVSGFKKKVNDAGLWVSTFFLRMIKMKEGQVEFKEEGFE